MTGMIRWLFPCWFDEPQCAIRFWGCRCGKKGGSKKAEQRADDLARQQAAQGASAQQATQQAYALTPEEQAREQATFGLEGRQLPFLEGRGRATGEDLIRQLGPDAGAYLDLISKRLGMSPEQLFGGQSQTAAALQDIIGQRLQTPPSIPFEDVFNPEFELLKQDVANSAARRGFGGGSGLELEQLGRSGVELAIRQAGLRQQNAQINAALRQQSLEDAAQLVNSQQGLGLQARGEAGALTEFGAGLSQNARAELADYLSNMQRLSQTGRGRQAEGVTTSYGVANPYQQRSAEFNRMGFNALNTRVQQSQARQAQLAQTIAMLAAAPFTGGMSLMAAPTIFSQPGQDSQQGLLSGWRQGNAAQPFRGQGWSNYPNENLDQIYGQPHRNWWGG